MRDMLKIGVRGKIEISGSELLLMSIIWDNPNGINYQRLTDEVNSKYDITWSTQTVCTFAKRLKHKGVIGVRREGRFARYYPVISREEYLTEVANSLSIVLFNGNMEKLKEFIRESV